MSNIGFGLWMTVMGMGTVFAMLALLMGVLALMGLLDKRKKPEAETEDDFDAILAEDTPSDVSLAKPGSVSRELVAAVTVAAVTHQRVRRGQAAPEMREVRPGSHLFASRWVSIGRSYQNTPWK